MLLFEKGATAGVDVRGGSPGTRDTELLNPVNTVQQVQGLLLSGGSAFGLEAASGVMRYLEEHRLGYAVGDVVVPIVPGAILYDLEIGDSKIRPTAESGYKACQAASKERVVEGNVGAGAGATIGKMFGMKQAMKSGLGSASLRVGNTGIVVGCDCRGECRRRRGGSQDRQNHRGRPQARWIGLSWIRWPAYVKATACDRMRPGTPQSAWWPPT